MTMMIHDMEVREQGRAEGRKEERTELLSALVRDGFLPSRERP